MEYDERKIRVAVTGAAGKMGRTTCAAVGSAEDMSLVAAIDCERVGMALAEHCGLPGLEGRIEADLRAALERERPAVLVDFTRPEAATDNALAALEHGAAPVVGTTGLSPTDLARIERACERTGLPALVVPNFALGAVLMVRFAEQAAKWLPHVEIVEMHHDSKLDAPSGTAMLTAKRIAESRGRDAEVPRTETLKAEGARGALVEGVPIHSVRLKGLVAHQEVLFGGPGETLTIRHDSLDRASFMPGVLLAIRQVRSLKGFVMGLDALLFA